MKNHNLRQALQKVQQRSDADLVRMDIEIINPTDAFALRGGSAPKCPNLESCGTFGSCGTKCGIKVEL